MPPPAPTKPQIRPMITPQTMDWTARFFRGDALHGLLGGHDRADDELDAQQEGHEDREAAHGGRGEQTGDVAAHHREQQHACHHDEAVLDVQILVFMVGVGRYCAGQHVRRKGDADSHIRVHTEEGDEHRADDGGGAHPRKAGAKARAHPGKKRSQRS